DSKRLEFPDGGQDVVATRTRAAMTLARVVQLLGDAQSPGVLAVSPVNDIAECMHTFPRIVVEPNPAPCFAIDQRYLFTSAQVFDCFRAFCRRHTVGNTAAIAAAIQTEDQAWLLRGSAMHERVHAKCTMGAHEPRVAPLEEVEAGPPHQRPI